MNIRNRNILKNYILEYISSITNEKINKKSKLFTCPVCRNEKQSASIYPVNSARMVCYRPSCNFNGDIFDLTRSIEKMPDWTDNDISNYLSKIFKIKFPEDTYKYFEMYQKLGWALFQVASIGDTKQPIEKEWQNSEHKNPEDWKEWIDNGLNIGLNIKNSNCMVLDIDSLEELDKIIDKENNLKLKDILEETLEQKTAKGLHEVYEYDPDFKKTLNKVLKDAGFNFELRVGGAYILIAPSSSKGEIREWNQKPIKKIHPRLKEFLLKFQDTKEQIIVDDEIQKDIEEENLKDINLNGLNGCCNDSFIKFFGVLRKKLPREQLEYTAFNFNKLLSEPFDNRTIRNMLDQIEKYRTFDKKEIGKKVLNHLEVIEEGTSFEISTSLRIEKKDIEDTLKYLQDEGKIYKRGKIFRSLKRASWKDTFVKESGRLDFSVPYFDQYATFRNGDMIVIGAAPGIGKSTVSLNLLKGIVDQGKKPYYINLESGNRFVSIATKIGLKEGDFNWVNHYNPQSIELEDNAITIIDWLLVENHAETDQVYKKLSEQLDKHGGLLIVLTQLKEFEDEKNKKRFYSFYAENQLIQFPAFVTQYKYDFVDGLYSNEYTLFETRKIRESKINKQRVIIPTFYNHETKILELR